MLDAGISRQVPEALLKFSRCHNHLFHAVALSFTALRQVRCLAWHLPLNCQTSASMGAPLVV